jgi:hypothetical protein
MKDHLFGNNGGQNNEPSQHKKTLKWLKEKESSPYWDSNPESPAP